MGRPRKRMSNPGTALRKAAAAGDISRVRMLLRAGVDANAADLRRRTPLLGAAAAGHVAVVDELLGAGAWVNPHEDFATHDTPLVAAVKNGHMRVVRMLIEAGANPFHHIGEPPRTALAYARIHGHAAIVDYFAAFLRPLPLSPFPINSVEQVTS